MNNSSSLSAVDIYGMVEDKGGTFDIGWLRKRPHDPTGNIAVTSHSDNIKNSGLTGTRASVTMPVGSDRVWARIVLPLSHEKVTLAPAGHVTRGFPVTGHNKRPVR